MQGETDFRWATNRGREMRHVERLQIALTVRPHLLRRYLSLQTTRKSTPKNFLGGFFNHFGNVRVAKFNE